MSPGPSSSAAASLLALLLLLVLGLATHHSVLAVTYSTSNPSNQTITRYLVPQSLCFSIVPYLSTGSPDTPLVTVSSGGTDAGAPGFCNLLLLTGTLTQTNIQTLSYGVLTQSSVFKLIARTSSLVTLTFNLPTTGVAAITVGPIAATFTTSPSVGVPVSGVPWIIPGFSFSSYFVTLTVTIRIPANSLTGTTENITVSGTGGTPGPISLSSFSCIFGNSATCNTQVGLDLGSIGFISGVSVALGFSFIASSTAQTGNTDFPKK